MTLELKCPCRCWRSICQPTLRSMAGRRPRSPETRSTRTCCSIPASNICTSPGRKGSVRRTPPSASAHQTRPDLSFLHSFFSYLINYFVWPAAEHLSPLPPHQPPIDLFTLPRFNLLCLFIRLPPLCPFIFQAPSFSASTQEPSERYWLRNELIKCTSRGWLTLIKTRDNARPA